MTATQSSTPVRYQPPEDPSDTILTLTIKVEAGEGDSLNLSGAYFPGGKLESEMLHELFQTMDFSPRVGTYTLEAWKGGIALKESPEGTTNEEQSSLYYAAQMGMVETWVVLFMDLMRFPSDEDINTLARHVAGRVIVGSLERGGIKVGPVANPATMLVEDGGDFSIPIRSNIDLARVLKGLIQVELCGGIAFRLDERDGQPVLLVSYLKGGFFAPDLNAVLIARLREQLAIVTPGVVTEILAQIEFQRRLEAASVASLTTTFDIDPDAVQACADAMIAEAFPDSVQSYDDNDQIGEPTAPAPTPEVETPFQAPAG